LSQAEERCFEIVAEARPTKISFETTATGLRKESTREGTLRIVSIEGVDRSACGGTHVRLSSEIGLVLTGKTEKIRGITRIEFVCGLRALHRARADNHLLATIARTLSQPAEQAPERIIALTEQNKSLEKERQRLATEQARREGAELYWKVVPDAKGLRRAVARGPIDEATRNKAQSFTANEQAVFLAVCDNPPSILLAASPDSGLHAGTLVKEVLAEASGRGGGNATLAQGSVPDAEALEKVFALLEQRT
jgi:alanyl-tRNA synthetase